MHSIMRIWTKVSLNSNALLVKNKKSICKVLPPEKHGDSL